MSLIEEIGQLNILYIIIPSILIAIAVHKLRKAQKQPKKQEIPVTPPVQSDMIEPVAMSDLKVDTTPKPPMTQVQTPPATPTKLEPPQIFYLPEGGGDIAWNRVFIVSVVIALFIFLLIFGWGVYTDKFKSSSNVETNYPDIEIPECVPPEIPDCICNPAPCICNTTVEAPIVNVYYNLTNSTV